MYKPEIGLQDMVRPLIDIHREFGWPGEGYSKEEAIGRVMECEQKRWWDEEEN